jgi:hypothetical protein
VLQTQTAASIVLVRMALPWHLCDHRALILPQTPGRASRVRRGRRDAPSTQKHSVRSVVTARPGAKKFNVAAVREEAVDDVELPPAGWLYER